MLPSTAILAASLLAAPQPGDCPGDASIWTEAYRDTDGDGVTDCWMMLVECCGIMVYAERNTPPVLSEDWQTVNSWLTGKSTPYDPPQEPANPDDPPPGGGISPLQQCMDGAIYVCGKGCVLTIAVTAGGCSFTCDTKSPCGPGTAPSKTPDTEA